MLRTPVKLRTRLHRNYGCGCEICKTVRWERFKRYKRYKSLHRGDRSQVVKALGCDPGIVSSILTGHPNEDFMMRVDCTERLISEEAANVVRLAVHTHDEISLE